MTLGLGGASRSTMQPESSRNPKSNLTLPKKSSSSIGKNQLVMSKSKVSSSSGSGLSSSSGSRTRWKNSQKLLWYVWEERRKANIFKDMESIRRRKGVLDGRWRSKDAEDNADDQVGSQSRIRRSVR